MWRMKETILETENFSMSLRFIHSDELKGTHKNHVIFSSTEIKFGSWSTILKFKIFPLHVLFFFSLTFFEGIFYFFFFKTTFLKNFSKYFFKTQSSPQKSQKKPKKAHHEPFVQLHLKTIRNRLKVNLTDGYVSGKSENEQRSMRCESRQSISIFLSASFPKNR